MKQINWKEVGIKALVAFLGGAFAELSVIQVVDWNTLWAGLSLATIRGVVNVAIELSKDFNTAGKSPDSFLSLIRRAV